MYILRDFLRLVNSFQKIKIYLCRDRIMKEIYEFRFYRESFKTFGNYRVT